MDITLNNRRAYAYTGGRPFDATRRTAVFIHGGQNDHSVWALQTRWFAHHGWSVLALDLPGHGNSDGPPLTSIAAMADWVAAWLDALGVKQAALIGHSMGTLIALELAGRENAPVSAIALLGAAAPMAVSDTLLAATRDNPAAAIDMITAWSHSGWAQKPQAPGPGAYLNWGGRRLMQRIAARHGADVLPTDFAAVSAYQDGLVRAEKVQCPALLVSGGRDVMTPPKAAKALAAALRDVKTVTLPEAGHAMMGEAPDAVLQALAQFLNQAVAVSAA
ncbi:alpha/beta hydrolase [Pigmentiphaga aceris]|uniref:Alpha/beta hydrolase n=1 Tax=Pigmentiphaga aceris TaxID=1940612 RepID=A0A5C0AX44_9BURK|nr:alpha/beta hydrolase [Pigmentiphaga aceris]QEI06989.1 alpha/beta hydrolase [Pigmentiphaga aceris]